MKNLKALPFLELDRQKTDDSLIAERDKTNESITKARGKAEHQTDKFVKEERVEADQITSSARVEADTHRDIERKTETVEPDTKADQKISDNRLLDERRSADKTVKKERAVADAAIAQERDLKNTSANKLLKQEREQTDEHLSVERAHTDLKAHQTSNLLSDEIAEHSRTKVSLTTRDEFVAIVSHDLRNPLATISMCAEMLLEESTNKEMNSEIKESIELIQRNAATALRLIADILDMERIAKGKLELQLKKYSIANIIRESIENFVQAASIKKVLLRAAHANISGDVTCDHDRILQVLSNLIGNALKFTPEGGSVVLNAHLSETEVQVSVCDTGPGIPEEKQDHIFARYAQLGSKDRSGLGLGLYISKMLIEAHQGRLWVQSKVGEGSTFFFTLPR